MNGLQFAVKAFTFSPLRTLEYDEVKNHELSGRVLDLGGGGIFMYSKLFRGKI